MSAGSGASNLGYGNIMPNSNINSSYVNVTGGNYPGGFGSNETQAGFGLSGLSNNVCAANASVMGSGGSGSSGMWGGGRKKSKRNIAKMGKRFTRSIMKRTRRLGKTIKRTMKSVGKMTKKTLRSIGIKLGGRRRRKPRYNMRGGTYQQYGSNVPNTPTFAVGGPLSPSLSAMANPPIYQTLPTCTNCADSYNHYNDPATNSRAP